LQSSSIIREFYQWIAYIYRQQAEKGKIRQDCRNSIFSAGNFAVCSFFGKAAVAEGERMGLKKEGRQERSTARKRQ